MSWLGPAGSQRTIEGRRDSRAAPRGRPVTPPGAQTAIVLGRPGSVRSLSAVTVPHLSPASYRHLGHDLAVAPGPGEAALDPVGFQKLVFGSTCVIGMTVRHGMIATRVLASALPSLLSAGAPLVVARPLVSVYGHRTPGVAPCGCRFAQSQPEAPPGLDRGAMFTTLEGCRRCSQASLGHAEHDPALASSPGR